MCHLTMSNIYQVVFVLLIVEKCHALWLVMKIAKD